MSWKSKNIHKNEMDKERGYFSTFTVDYRNRLCLIDAEQFP